MNTIINIFKAAHINIDIPQDTTIIWNYQIFTEQLLRIYILLGLVENKNKGSINNREDMFITQMYQDDKYDLFKEKSGKTPVSYTAISFLRKCITCLKVLQKEM